MSVFLFFIFKKFNSLQIYLILNSLLRLQCCAILVAIIYINTHSSVLFYYLIFISLLTQLLPMFSTQPLCFPTIHAITCLFSCNYTSLSLFSSSHITEKQKNTTLNQTGFCTSFQPNWHGLLEETESTFKTFQELSQSQFTVSKETSSLLTQIRPQRLHKLLKKKCTKIMCACCLCANEIQLHQWVARTTSTECSSQTFSFNFFKDLVLFCSSRPKCPFL